MEEVINHLCHKHPLKLLTVQEAESKYQKCYGCGFTFSTAGPSPMIYACDNREEEECYNKVYLCSLCAHIPKIIFHHPLHYPSQGHHLKLVSESPYIFTNWCNACGEKIPRDEERLFYHCDEGGFDLHVHCTHSLVPPLTHAAHHSHLLTLVHTNYTRFRRPWECKSCYSRLLDGVVFVRCVQCEQNYHIQCYESLDKSHSPLPKVGIKHQIKGHSHPLTLVTQESNQYLDFFFCHACEKWDWPQRWVFKCLECNNFTSHLSCHSIQFPPHSHLSSFSLYTDLSSNIDNQCQGCKKVILKGRPSYGCLDQCCNMFVDDSCLQQCQALDKQVHPVHPQHPLIFMFNHGKQFMCACCGKKCKGFMFGCQDCKFFLHLECILLVVPSKQHQDHHDIDHILIFLDKIGTYPKSSYLRCMKCKRDFSFTECLLPYTIQHQCHFHPLSLVPRLVENDDTDQCYCDVCEEKRDPDECIYYCRECKFEAHIGCVKLGVLKASRNCKLKAGQFVTPQQLIEEESKKIKKEGHHGVLLKEVLLPLNELEVEEIKNVLKVASNLTWETSLGEIPSYDNNSSTKILFSDEPFKNFVNKLNSIIALEVTHEMVLRFLKGEYEVVCEGEYLVPLNFEHTLEALFDKHGDFGAKCTLSPKTKKFLFLAFCKALQSMWNTKVAEIEDSSLIQWWIYFAIAQAARFSIQFAFENLKRAIYAHFGLQADKNADRKLTNARIEMRELPRKIEAQEKELQKTRERFEMVIIEENELREASFRAKKSHLMRKCLIEAEDLVCYSLGELFFPPNE